MFRTRRLAVRKLTLADAGFVVTLLNDPAFLQFIGDRGVRNVEDAIAYLQSGPLQSYSDHGYGLYLAERLSDGTPCGFCGLVRRDWLEDADVGFALLPAFRRQGLALEAASATLDHAFHEIGLDRVFAIVRPDNRASTALLGKLGMHVVGDVRAPGEQIDLHLYEARRAS